MRTTDHPKMFYDELMNEYIYHGTKTCFRLDGDEIRDRFGRETQAEDLINWGDIIDCDGDFTHA